MISSWNHKFHNGPVFSASKVTFLYFMLVENLEKLFLLKYKNYVKYVYLSIGIANRWIENKISRCKNIHQWYCIILQLMEKTNKSGFHSFREAASTRSSILPFSFIKRNHMHQVQKHCSINTCKNEKYRECYTITFNECIHFSFYWFKWSKHTVN